MCELRKESSKFLQTMKPSDEVVLTNNGKPVAIISGVTEDTLEDTLYSIRRSRTLRALGKLQTQSVSKGTDQITEDEIEAEIQATRKAR